MAIRAGVLDEIGSNDSSWVYIDIGFSSAAESCGVLIDEEQPIERTFSSALKIVCEHIESSSVPVSLVVEAPLSVAFNKDGNPQGRVIEKLGRETRYWYSGAGPAVQIAATYLMHDIKKIADDNEIRLFEGFVSFKDSSTPSNHSADVTLLKLLVDGREKYVQHLISAEKLKMNPTDQLKSAFDVCGDNFGIPPVIIAHSME